MISALEALQRLREGNRRFISDDRASDALVSGNRRREVATSQEPFAIILGCSDSRVPAEIVFDQGLGDLFVIRVAGNIVAPSGIGSVEFAAARFRHAPRGGARPFPLRRDSRNPRRTRPAVDGTVGQHPIDRGSRPPIGGRVGGDRSCATTQPR